jgi:Ca-activated chloride channel homolog
VAPLTWPLLALVLGAVVVLVLVLSAVRRRRAGHGVLVAHTDRLRALPRYRALARRELALAGVCTSGALLVVGSAVLLAARPYDVVALEPESSGRDVQLCLDVSASMDRWNEEVVAGFADIAEDLEGDRIGLTIFSGAAVVDFPLTDDAGFVRRELRAAAEAFEAATLAYFEGTDTAANRASQVGDGLVSCLERLESSDRERGRAVILASDNDPLGSPVFTLAEAAEEAVRDDVVVYALGTPSLSRRPPASAELADAARATGGRMFVLGEGESTDEVVEGIQRLEESRLAQAPQLLRVDTPGAGLAVGGLGLVLLVGGGVAGGVLGRRR